MAEHFSFFDAVLLDDGVTYDREYNAQQFTKYFGALVTTGVMKGTGNMLAVSANGSNMVTKINTGIAFVEAKYYENDSFKELTHDTETLGNSRIDRIVVRMDLSTEARYVRAFIKKGVPSTNPVAPALTQTPNLYEISLAQVKVVGGQTFITTNAVTDERGVKVICPWAGSNILPSFDDNALKTHMDDFAKHTPYVVTTGTGAIYEVNLGSSVTELFEGLSFTMKLHVDSMYGAKLNVNGLGNSFLTDIYGNSLFDKPLLKGCTITVRYNGNQFIMQGVTLLENVLTSNSTTRAATANTVKMVNDKLIGNTVAIGGSSSANYFGVGIGMQAKSIGSQSVAIGTGAESTANFCTAIGSNAQALNNGEGILGTKINVGAHIWKVPGNFSVQGTKQFEIPHPHPGKRYTHILRHSAVESPNAGDTLYRYVIDAQTDGETVELRLPDYFRYLNKNVDVYVSPHLHFGRAFGIVEGDILKVTCEKAGQYKALIIGTRNDDHDSVQTWDIKGVEREIGESWTGETYSFEVDEIAEVSEFKEEL